MNKENLQEISQEMIKRYSSRYESLGYDVKTLGWGSSEQQEFRFLQTLSMDLEIANNSILDIGCGFGDYYKFLVAQSQEPKMYIGVDINPNLVNEANAQYNDKSKVDFQVHNILDKPKNEVFDITVMLGVLNLNLKGKVDNYEYSYSAIKNAFDSTDKLLVVDFLSNRHADTYEKEDFVFYHDPARMLEFALTITDNVVIKHNYSPIPQKEFMLFLYK